MNVTVQGNHHLSRLKYRHITTSNLSKMKEDNKKESLFAQYQYWMMKKPLEMNAVQSGAIARTKLTLKIYLTTFRISRTLGS